MICLFFIIIDLIVIPTRYCGSICLISENIVDGLFQIARSLEKVSESINKLGLGNAFTNKGAIEVLAQEIKEGFELIK